MMDSSDIMSSLVGLVVGFAIGFVLRKKNSALESHLTEKTVALEKQNQELLQKSAKLENELEKEAEALGAQLKLIEATKAQMTADFKAMSLEALNASRDNFLSIAQEKFTQLQTTAQANMKETVTPLAHTLKMMDEKVTMLEKERHGAYGELREHLKTMKTDQDKLRGETASLVQALRSPSTRGQWGEMQLKRTLEMAGLVEGVHFDQQVTAGDQRPDVILRLTGGKSIVVDSKAPIEAYLDALKEGATEADRIAALDRHARHVREHIKQLSTKAYWERFETPELVVMFLPGEGYFSAALERDPSLLEAGVDQKILLASPITLIGLAKAVVYGWQQEKLADNIREISELGSELYKRLSTYGEHMQKIGKGLKGAMVSYNDAIGSLERSVLPSARKLQERQSLSNEQTLPVIDQLDTSIRQLTAAEFVDSESVTPLKTAENG